MPAESLRGTFNESASVYQRARPDYPDELYDDITVFAKTTPPAELLEIGAGPGLATVPMARRGFAITALELGPDLAHEARLNLAAYPAVSVITSAFEEWQPPAGTSFDLVYAANSWQWLDPEIRLSKTAGLLRPGGHLAIFGASHAFPEGFDPFFTEIQPVYDEIGLGAIDWPPPPPAQTNGNLIEQAVSSGLFQPVAQLMYQWALRYDADSYIDLLNTFGNHIALEPSQRNHLYSEVRRRLAARADGKLTRHWISQLAILQRI